jgi:hypothetical protein
MLRNWLVGVAILLGVSIVVGPRLFGQSTPLPVDASPAEAEVIDPAPREVSDAERRFLSGQPRHWRQLMIRR